MLTHGACAALPSVGLVCFPFPKDVAAGGVGLRKTNCTRQVTWSMPGGLGKQLLGFANVQQFGSTAPP